MKLNIDSTSISCIDPELRFKLSSLGKSFPLGGMRRYLMAFLVYQVPSNKP